MSPESRLATMVVMVAYFIGTQAINEQVSHLRGDPIDIELLRKSGDGTTTQDHYSRELVCRVDMVGLRGEYTYHYRPETAQTVCATYLLSESSDLVEIEFTEFNVDCNDPANQIQFFDGWTMGEGSFPSETDHPLSMADRVTNVCSQRRSVFRANQNGAMITFKLGSPTARFTLTFRPVRNPEPCNVIAPEPSGSHTLRNFGGEKNCSLSIIYPTTVHIMEMAVGDTSSGDAKLRCQEGLDYVELLEGNSLDMSRMQSESSICGHVGSNSRSATNQIPSGGAVCQSGVISVPLMCHNSMIRLVSSSQHNNQISFRFSRLSISSSRCPATK